MADERWRALERRWQQTGAVEDEAALLVERVRAGALVEARARLVAWLGHEAAVPAVGPGFDARQGQDAFWRGVVAFGAEVAVRAALALARRRRRQIDDALRTIASEAQRRPGEEFMAWGRAASQCVDSAVSWVLAPTEVARAVLERDVLRMTRAAARPGKAVSELTASVLVLADLARGGEGRPWETVAIAEELDLVRAVMRAEVVPWALGQRDPLMERLTKIKIRPEDMAR